MARQPKKEDEKVETLSTHSTEPVPDEPGKMTAAAQKAQPKEPTILEPAKAVAKAAPSPDPKVKWYRVMADRNVMSSNGFRARLRMGKELNSTQYNIAKLRAQGVQLQEMDPSEVSAL